MLTIRSQLAFPLLAASFIAMLVASRAFPLPAALHACLSATQETACRLGNRRSVATRTRLHAVKDHDGSDHNGKAEGLDPSAAIDLLQKVQKAKEEARGAEERSKEAAEQAEKAAERLKAIEEEALAEMQRAVELLQGCVKSLESDPDAPTSPQLERTREVTCAQRTRNVQERIRENHWTLMQMIFKIQFKIKRRVMDHVEGYLMDNVRPDLVWEGEALDQREQSSRAHASTLGDLHLTMVILHSNRMSTVKTDPGTNVKANMKTLVTQAMQLLCNNTITEDIEELPS